MAPDLGSDTPDPDKDDSDAGYEDEEYGWEEIEIKKEPEYEEETKFDEKFVEFRKRLKDSEDLEVEGNVFDVPTLKALYKLVNDGHIEAIGGPVSTGKEANVFEGLGRGGKEVAIKIYRITTSNFRKMNDYLEGDPRFKGIKDTKKEIVIAWTKKESANLERASKAGVRVPKPIASERNILVMEFIGNEGKHAPRLKDVNIENPQTAYEGVSEYMKRLYRSGLIHGDLSEYNILVHEGELVFIDMGQAVTVHHPNSDEFLKRDCENIARFFSSKGVDVTGEDLLEFVKEEG